MQGFPGTNPRVTLYQVPRAYSLYETFSFASPNIPPIGADERPRLSARRRGHRARGAHSASFAHPPPPTAICRSLWPAIPPLFRCDSSAGAPRPPCRLSAWPAGYRPQAIAEFEGCYHGDADGLLVKAGSAWPHLASPARQACRKRLPALPLPCPYNNIQTF